MTHKLLALSLALCTWGCTEPVGDTGGEADLIPGEQAPTEDDEKTPDDGSDNPSTDDPASDEPSGDEPSPISVTVPAGEELAKFINQTGGTRTYLLSCGESYVAGQVHKGLFADDKKGDITVNDITITSNDGCGANPPRIRGALHLKGDSINISNLRWDYHEESSDYYDEERAIIYISGRDNRVSNVEILNFAGVLGAGAGSDGGLRIIWIGARRDWENVFNHSIRKPSFRDAGGTVIENSLIQNWGSGTHPVTRGIDQVAIQGGNTANAVPVPSSPVIIRGNRILDGRTDHTCRDSSDPECGRWFDLAIQTGNVPHPHGGTCAYPGADEDFPAVIEDNIIDGTFEGLHLKANRATIRDNTFRNVNTAIGVRKSVGTTIEGNLFENIWGVSPAAPEGGNTRAIAIYIAENLVIRGNAFMSSHMAIATSQRVADSQCACHEPDNLGPAAGLFIDDNTFDGVRNQIHMSSRGFGSAGICGAPEDVHVTGNLFQRPGKKQDGSGSTNLVAVHDETDTWGCTSAHSPDCTPYIPLEHSVEEMANNTFSDGFIHQGEPKQPAPLQLSAPFDDIAYATGR